MSGNTGATTLQRIKRAVDTEKSKKTTAEARIASLTEEQARLYTSVATDLEKPVQTVEEVESAVAEIYGKITADVAQMEKILEEEGVSY